MQAFALFFKLITILVVLFAALAADRDVALVAVLAYGLAYTFELGLSLATYFGARSA
jgi:general stress protein CsbA